VQSRIQHKGGRAVIAGPESPDHVIPGHDPLVMQRYPAPAPELEVDMLQAPRRARA
jgi:hypothetical protein